MMRGYHGYTLAISLPITLIPVSCIPVRCTHAYWGGWRVFPRLSWRSSFSREMRVHPRQVRGSVIKGGNAGGGKGVSPTRPAVRVVVRR